MVQSSNLGEREDFRPRPEETWIPNSLLCSFLVGKTAPGLREPPTPSSAEVKERIELYFCSSLDLHSLPQGEIFIVREGSTFGVILKTWA
jgi:hypothetical protein